MLVKWIDGWMGELLDGWWMDGWTDGWLAGWIDEWEDE